MAAAPVLVVGNPPLASPELALVDADLAAELRLGLCPVADTWLSPRTNVEETRVTIEEDVLVERDPANDRRDPAPVGAEPVDTYDYIIEVIDQPPAQSQSTSSHYPVLPSPEPEEEAIDETDTALRRIRERLTEADSSSVRKRRLRRPFTYASGASALCAIGLLATDVQLQVAQLPGWLRFWQYVQ